MDKEVKIICPFCKLDYIKTVDIISNPQRLQVVCAKCGQYFSMTAHENINY